MTSEPPAAGFVASSIAPVTVSRAPGDTSIGAPVFRVTGPRQMLSLGVIVPDPDGCRLVRKTLVLKSVVPGDQTEFRLDQTENGASGAPSDALPTPVPTMTVVSGSDELALI